jgi:hypothetical protein
MQMLSRNFKNVKFLMNQRHYLFSTEQVSKGKLVRNSLTKTFKDFVKRIDL